jgi:hypothetical protein
MGSLLVWVVTTGSTHWLCIPLLEDCSIVAHFYITFLDSWCSAFWDKRWLLIVGRVYGNACSCAADIVLL